MSRFRGGTWDPKFPDFAVEREGPLSDESSALDNSRGEWFEAPADSHVMRFAYWDQRTSPLHKKFLKISHLVVVFKPSKMQPAKQYTYEFKDPDEGKRVLELLKNAEHPGEIVHQELILKQVPYTRDA